MSKNNNNKGNFKKIPSGHKTPKMLEVEKRLGCTIEKDYQVYYIDKDWGQQRIADRWRVPRGNIFNTNMPGGRQSWVQRLNLPKKNGAPKTDNSKKNICEIIGCGYSGKLEKAHWISSRNGGSRKNYNILSLCPTHHTELDNENEEITEKALIILFNRSMKYFLSKNELSFDEKRETLKIAKQIINRLL